MSLIVEDGTGISTADSYGALADADAYHAKLGNADWSDVAAKVTLTANANFADGNTIVIIGTAYTLTTGSVAAGQGHKIKIGATAAATLQTIVDVFNGVAIIGVDYCNDSPAIDFDVSAEKTSDTTIVITSTTPGAAANTTTCTLGGGTNQTLIRFSSPTFRGGQDVKEVALRKATRYLTQKYGRRWQGQRRHRDQALDWPRTDVVDRDGWPVDRDSVPQRVKDAQFEVALYIAQGNELFAPVEPEDSGSLQSSSTRVGPISISESFGGGLAVAARLPRVDSILGDLVGSSDERIRG